MLIWKPLTKTELKKNKKNPDKPQIVPHTAFYMSEDKSPDEVKIWESLSFESLSELYRDLYSKK